MSSMGCAVTIRRAKRTDAARIATLCGQLGYPTTTKRMAQRLKNALREKKGVCLVAQAKAGGVMGWVQASVTPLLVVERRADVNGLVVEEKLRGCGIGAKLLEAVETWARKMRCAAVSLRSNVTRETAHAFYQKQGYELYKTQKAFQKQL